MDSGELMKFCADEQEVRYYLQRPFRCEKGIVATNGHLAIIIPDDGRKDVAENEGKIDMEKPLASCPPGDTWARLSEIDIPEGEPCVRCNGSGEVLLVECAECDGFGEFDHGSHTYECKECDGSGNAYGDGEGELETCYACRGVGERWATITIGRVTFQRRYISLLATLPGCEISTTASDKGGRIRFDGGYGAIMGIRT